MATHAPGDRDRSVSIGRILGRAFATIGDNPITMFGIAFLFGALPGMAVGYFQQQAQLAMLNEVGSPAITLLTVIGVVLGIVFSMLTQGALVRATVAYSEGRRASFGDSITVGLRVVLPLFLLGLLLSIAVAIGLLFLIVPGVILYIMWSVASPALVEERHGVFAAFGRSRALTKGARWKILGLNLIVLVFYMIGLSLIGIVTWAFYGAAVLADPGAPRTSFAYLLGSAAVQTVTSAIWAAIQTSLYVELRNWKDGPATQVLADIFA